MLRRTFLQGAAAASAATAATPAPPNILFVMPDQWRGCDLGSAGNTQVRTPNLDRLAASGIQFDAAMANCPVCTPARAILLTGKYAHTVGLGANDHPLPSEENGIAKVLSKAGYYTGLVGKWHLEGGKRLPGFVAPGPRRQGFDFWAANICSHAYNNQTYFRDDPTPIKMPGYETKYWTDLGLEFLERAAERKQPWFLCMHYGPPHDPYLLPPGYEKAHDPEKVELRPNWKQPERLGSRRDIAAYYSAIDSLDEQIGRLLARVDDNTLVLFLSDHGDMLGSHGTFLKRKPWEESARVPMIFSWKRGLQGGWRSKIPISHIDIVPTLLELAGQKAPGSMHGQSLAPYLRNRRGRTPAHAMIMSHSRTENREWGPWRGLRTERWKYARFEDRPWVLYDLNADPFEQNNLAGKADYTKLMAGFDKTVFSWMKQHRDSWAEQFPANWR